MPTYNNSAKLLSMVEAFSNEEELRREQVCMMAQILINADLLLFKAALRLKQHGEIELARECLQQCGDLLPVRDYFVTLLL
jgi:hypothetical protein